MKGAARALLLAGGLAIGLFLFRAAPRDVTLVYGLSPRPVARALEVEIARGGEALRRAELRVAAGERQASHRVRLTDGDYRLRVAVRDGGVREVERAITVSESGPIVLPLE